MNFYAISALINFITSAVLGITVIYKTRKSQNVTFFIFCFFVAFWSFGYYFWQIAKTSEDALFWCRFLMAGAIFIPVAYLHFVYALVEILAKRKRFLIFSYFLFFLFFVLDFTSFFVNRVESLYSFKFWPMPGPIYSIFLIAWFIYVIYSTYLLFEKYKNSKGIIREQIKYVFIGMVVGFAGGSTNYFLWYKIPISPIANVLVSVYVGTVAYAILRYRLMDIRIVARKIVIYFLSAGFVYGMFYLVAWIFNKSFGGIYNKGAYVLGLVIAPLFVLLFIWFNGKIKGIANKYLFFSLYSNQEIIAKLTDQLTNSIDLNKIVDSIVNSIKEAMQLDKAEVLLIGQSEKAVEYSFLTDYLRKKQKPLVRDELQMAARDSGDPAEREKIFQLLENMKRLDVSLCLPMLISNKLIGIILLGSKLSGDAYTNEDLELLSTLSKQAAIAVDNARLYKEVQDFNKTLQQKVDEQTKDIKEAYEVEKRANKELKELDEAKTNFMLITQHHLRTPLSVIMGYLDLLLSGSYGKIPKEAVVVINKAEKSTKKEIDIVNDLLNVSAFQLGKGVMKLEQGINMESLLKEIAKDSIDEARNKGIYLKVKKAGRIPTIAADKIKLKLALANIIDNAVKYTEKGGVTAVITANLKSLLITIKDTGIGIAPENLKNLFNKTFERGQEAKKMFAVGKGIGLFLSAKIIEGHKGRVWAESEGEGKGSTFYAQLPSE